MVCYGVASNSVDVSEVTKAVNAFLGFSSGDQQALLEVIEDYFTSPADAGMMMTWRMMTAAHLAVHTAWKVQ